jgi:hypothetical protein
MVRVSPCAKTGSAERPFLADSVTMKQQPGSAVRALPTGRATPHAGFTPAWAIPSHPGATGYGRMFGRKSEARAFPLRHMGRRDLAVHLPTKTRDLFANFILNLLCTLTFSNRNAVCVLPKLRGLVAEISKDSGPRATRART